MPPSPLEYLIGSKYYLPVRPAGMKPSACILDFGVSSVYRSLVSGFEHFAPGQSTARSPRARLLRPARS